MFTEADLQLLHHHGINIDDAKKQIELLNKGTQFAKITAPATLENGLYTFNGCLAHDYEEIFRLNQEQYKIVYFVPASGAATRMFKDLFEYRNLISDFLAQNTELPEAKPSVEAFFNNLEHFSFFDNIISLFDGDPNSLSPAIDVEVRLKVLNILLTENGLGYGASPKALIKYFKNGGDLLDAHFAEATAYAKGLGNKVRLHFTISNDKQYSGILIERLNVLKLNAERNEPNIKIDVNYSYQSPSTDTVAISPNGELFRNADGTLHLRPGGHGSLLKNLNELDADIVFIKNVDNVAKPPLSEKNYKYKRMLGGVLLDILPKIHEQVASLWFTTEDPDPEVIANAENFVSSILLITPPTNYSEFSLTEKYNYLIGKLNRPVRVCGMVASEGDTGGGPFFVTNPDGSESLQVVETVEIDLKNPESLAVFKRATHFSPADYCCYIKDFRGNKFDLTQYSNPDAVFIVEKSSMGRKLIGIEHPGLWNGGMANWITIFYDVPAHTFNPIKTVNDLLNPAHK